MWKKWLGLEKRINLPTQESAQVLALCGSLRQDSLNKKLLFEAIAIAEKLNIPVEFFDLKQHAMVLYNGDLEAQKGLPDEAKLLRKKMMQVPLILIAACEHNASISSALKNAIDWASRNDEGKGSREAFKDRLFLLMGASPGKLGGARALAHLRSILENNGAIVIEETFTVPLALEAFDDKGQLKNEELKLKLQTLVQSALRRAQLV